MKKTKTVLDKLRCWKEHQTQTWHGLSGNAMVFVKPINITTKLSVLTTLSSSLRLQSMPCVCLTVCAQCDWQA